MNSASSVWKDWAIVRVSALKDCDYLTGATGGAGNALAGAPRPGRAIVKPCAAAPSIPGRRPPKGGLVAPGLSGTPGEAAFPLPGSATAGFEANPAKEPA